jgi:hypothetical protein
MWPRVVELMLGAWLLVSVFVFAGTPGQEAYTFGDAVCGAAVIAASLLAFWRPLRRANVATLAVALWLVGYGYLAAARPGPPAAQNDLVIGLLLLLFAILPTEVNRPPDGWTRS